MKIAEEYRIIPATPFTGILERLTLEAPEIWGAALVDPTGETVDYAGEIPPFGIQLAGSHMQIVVATAARLRSLSPAKFITVRATDQTLIAKCLPEAYVLVLVASPRVAIDRLEPALGRCIAAIAAEAGWPGPENADKPDYLSNSSN